MTVHEPPYRRPVRGEPTWDIAQLFPSHGVEEYLNLHTNRRVEFSDGVLEFLPTPTEYHEFLLRFLYKALSAFVDPKRLGLVMYAGIRVRTSKKMFRQPDIVFMLAEHSQRRHNKYLEGADLVVEVVSPDDPGRDLVKKRREYAQAGIPEYWIIDPKRRQVIVLTLKGKEYIEHGVFRVGSRATSVLLKGFGVSVTKLFASADVARKSGNAED